MPNLTWKHRVRSRFLVALLCSSCTPGSPSVPQLDSGVTLTGSWSITKTVTEVQGTCPGTNLGTISSHNSTFQQSGSTITVNDGSVGELDGALLHLAGSETTSAGLEQWNYSLLFEPDGGAFSGGGVATTSTSNEQCRVRYSLSGVRQPGSPLAVTRYIDRFFGQGEQGLLFDGNPPLSSGAPPPAITCPTQATNGSTINVTVQAGGQPAIPFEAVALYVEGVPGWYRTTFDNPLTAASMQLRYGTAIPSASFRCVYQVESDGMWSPATYVSISRAGPTIASLQAQLTWDSDSDLDLHLVEPSGFEIYYAASISQSGGRLDRASEGCYSGRLETVTYAGHTPPPTGQYIVRVDQYENCSAQTTNFVLRVTLDGQAPLLRTGSISGASTHGGPGSGIEILRFFY